MKHIIIQWGIYVSYKNRQFDFKNTPVTYKFKFIWKNKISFVINIIVSTCVTILTLKERKIFVIRGNLVTF